MTEEQFEQLLAPLEQIAKALGGSGSREYAEAPNVLAALREDVWQTEKNRGVLGAFVDEAAAIRLGLGEGMEEIRNAIVDALDESQWKYLGACLILGHMLRLADADSAVVHSPPTTDGSETLMNSALYYASELLFKAKNHVTPGV